MHAPNGSNQRALHDDLIFFMYHIQIAELWPKGAMDNHGIKGAICRAKERRKAFSNNEKARACFFFLL